MARTKAKIRCANVPVNKEKRLKPTGATSVERIRAHYNQLRNESGILSSAQELELELQTEFVSSIANMSAAVASLPKYSQLESALATLVGWKRFFWQANDEFTGAGYVRQTLLDKANSAEEIIRLLALEKALPKIKRLQASLFALAPDVSRTRLQELLLDQIVVGHDSKLLKNVVDDPVVLQRLHQRKLKHTENLAQVGIDEAAQETLEKLAYEITSTYDELRFVAGQSGLAIERLPNGGYVPIRMTEELQKLKEAELESWQQGYKKLDEVFQRERKSNLPVVLENGVEYLSSLFQKQLLGTLENRIDLTTLDTKLREETIKNAKLVRESEVIFRKEANATYASESNKLERQFQKQTAKETKAEVAKLKQQHKLKLAEEKASLQQEGYSASEIRSIQELTKAEQQLEIDDLVVEVEVKQDRLLGNALAKLDREIKQKLDKNIEAYKTSLSKETNALLDHTEAKLRLLELNTRPGELSKWLNANLTEAQQTKLFESGLLTYLPATSDDLLNFYRGVDTGVRGLSDAIVLDPVKALRDYGAELAESAKEQALFKTVFDQGADAGWVKAVVSPEEASSYVRIGTATKLRKWLPETGEELSNLYIHKTAADQLNALLELNTNVAEQANMSGAYRMFTDSTKALRRMFIASGGIGYIKRVFVQNAIALYASTGSLSQLPFAFVDYFRLYGNWKNKSTAKVTIGSKTYYLDELLRETIALRGGATASSLNDPRNFLDSVKDSLFVDDIAKERMQHFNTLYKQRYGSPLTGSMARAGKKASVALNTAYGVLAGVNAFLDNVSRWAAVRELAYSGKYKSLDEILVETDNYFSINADAGKVGQALGNFYMPFAQFAINSPGAAVRHAINHPWRATNVMLLYAQAAQATPLTEAELPEWVKDSRDYFFTVAKDPATGAYSAVFPGSVDFMLDSYMWFGNLITDLSGRSTGVKDYVDKQLEPQTAALNTLRDLFSKFYLTDFALSAMDVDPRSLRQFDKSAPTDTLLGVALSRRVRSLLVSAVPLLDTLDKHLPAFVTGQAPETTSLRLGGQDTGYQLQTTPGTPSWTGAMPSIKRTAKADWLGITGLSLQDIDPQQNIIATYRDLDTTVRELQTKRNRINKKALQQQQPLTDYERSYYNKLTRLQVILQVNKLRIDQLAAKKGLTPPVLYEQLQGKLDSLFNENIKYDDELQLMQLLEESQ